MKNLRGGIKLKRDKDYLLLYGVTDRTWVGKYSLLEQVDKSINGGATCIQIREKDITTQEFVKEAISIKEITTKKNIPLIINDSVEVAIQIKADGVHIGQEDMPVGEAREIIGEDMILGVSVANAEQAVEAEKKGADYLGAGAVFPTSTKDNATSVSKEELQRICDSVSIPVVAIGGICLENINKLKNTGIAGVAVVSAMYGSPNIESATRLLRSEVEKYI